jgi:hypothetical protein
MEVQVYTNLNAPTINEVEKQQTIEFIKMLPTIPQAYQSIPELEKMIPQQEMIFNLADRFNIKMSDAKSFAVQKEADALVKELEGMKASVE